jgi:hypothetical protein
MAVPFRDPASALAQDVVALLAKQREAVKVQPGPGYRVRVEARLDRARTPAVEVVLTASPSATPSAASLNSAERALHLPP